PFTKLAASDASHPTASATSSGDARRPIGTVLESSMRKSGSAVRWATRSVGVNDGATAFTRTPDGPSSSAAARVTSSIAAFAAAYGVTNGAALFTDADEMLTIAP